MTNVRRAQECDRDALLDLWERSVRATHHFLEDRDVVALRPFVAEELASDVLDWWVLQSTTGTLMGFLGFARDTIEGLFVDPDHRQQGAGKSLVAHAQSLAAGPLSVDVNEQNDAAVAFYAALGFVVVGRSATDSGGRPFPILHMTRPMPASPASPALPNAAPTSFAFSRAFSRLRGSAAGSLSSRGEKAEPRGKRTIATMTDRYDITLARPQDLPPLGSIELAAAQLLRGHAPETVLNEVTSERELADAQREGRLWVALASDTPVGFAHVKLFEPNAVHLDELDVHPDHGRRGLGTRLVAAVCAWAQARGVPVTLATFREVPWNMPFYARLGFDEIPQAELSPALRSVVADETRRGLDPARRLVMRWQPTDAER